MQSPASVPRATGDEPSTPSRNVDAAATAAAAAVANPASSTVSQPLSPTISVELHDNDASRLLPSPLLSSFQSPIRQHRRTPSQHREVKETLDAVSEFADDDEDGFAHHKINQYTIKVMIGRGSYGAVHLATDQYGHEYAIKEFSKSRLRKRARSNMMRLGPFHPGKHPGPGRPLGASARLGDESRAEAKDALYFIREEMAVMKKLNHTNLVQLIEVLDDPDEDSLYMVLEMCEKGVIMDVGLGKTAKPYDAEACRFWFRDLILGIEYLHAQNILHRDIKPDNLLITKDDVLKIGDFGVSEMFEKPDGMRTSKTAGSPAFLPPELCVALHGDVSGPACDIWSMGVTLYCLRYGKIPFEFASLLDIYDAINHAEVELPEDEDEDFVDLMHKILEKDPQKRITMPELREHSWVTKGGTDPLLSAEENCAEIEPPNALELNHAFTRNMGHLLCVMKAIRKFKSLIHSRENSPQVGPGSFMAGAMQSTSKLSSALTHSSGDSIDDEVARLVEERRNNFRRASLQTEKLLLSADEDITTSHTDTSTAQPGTEGETQQPLFVLGIGTGGVDDFSAEGRRAGEDVVSESPTTADFDVYDRAFQSEVQRIRSHNNRTVYLNKMLERESSGAAAQLPPRGFLENSTSDTKGGNSDSSAEPAAAAAPAGATAGSGASLTLADVVARALKSRES